MKLEISLFRFDKNSDYLPYYTKHFLDINKDTTFLELLNSLDKKESFGYEKNENFNIVANDIYVKTSDKLSDILTNKQTDLKIEPISIVRASNDLLINENDFYEKLELLKDFLTDELKQEYEELKPYYYASDSLEYNRDYIGDAVLILASKIMDSSDENTKNEILLALSSYEEGALYYSSSKKKFLNFNNEYENRIKDLQKALNCYEEESKQNFRVKNTLIIDFANFEKEYEIKHDFKDFNYAYYNSSNTINKEYLLFLDKLEGKLLNLDTKNMDLAKNSFHVNPKLTYFLASKIVLDAFDSAADFLIVDNEQDFYIFDYNRKLLEKQCGRDIVLPILHINEVQKLAIGNHKEVKQTLDKHVVNPEII
ncbi:MAG: hypothetical protein ACQERD_08370 [Campylobacterota bacterium]